MLPRITLITPSFNQADFLERTIQSVIDQQYPNLQWGIVDGGSTDGSLEIIHRYHRHFEFVIIETDGGQSEAINKGFRRADGDLLGWLNSDDTLMPGALHIVGRHFAEDETCHWLIGSSQTIDADDLVLAPLPPTGEFTLAGALIREEKFNVPQPSTFWRRNVTDAMGLLDETLHHCMDMELWCRFLHGKFQPRLIDDCLSCYRLHPQSKSCSQSPKFLEALVVIEKRYLGCLAWHQRLKLRQMISYQRRAHAVAMGKPYLLRQAMRRPWWFGSQQVLSALLERQAA